MCADAEQGMLQIRLLTASSWFSNPQGLEFVPLWPVQSIVPPNEMCHDIGWAYPEVIAAVDNGACRIL
jgi:hypothetical protein